MTTARYAPRTTDELTALLRDKDPRTRFIGGGTDLLIDLGERPSGLIWLGDLPGAGEIRETGDGVEIGSGVTMAELEQSPLLSGPFTALRQAAGSVGSAQIRNAATIGGNLANGAPAADTLPPWPCWGPTSGWPVPAAWRSGPSPPSSGTDSGTTRPFWQSSCPGSQTAGAPPSPSWAVAGR